MKKCAFLFLSSPTQHPSSPTATFIHYFQQTLLDIGRPNTYINLQFGIIANTTCVNTRVFYCIIPVYKY
ncbi:hypothetical protein F4774DRAFT_387420 [Daldinia eschscholtzii]|nr:hypothetical protein F4774DRAFT_387420 [Daldinia eschscholtzii]